MRVGVIAPTFRDNAEAALAVAHRAEGEGLDGVFCYDHLWPIGNKARPALAPFAVLGYLAARTSSVVLAPLVARVGLGSAEHLATSFRTLAALAPGRVVAPLGTGDRLSAEENLAYGIAYPDATARRAEMAQLAGDLRTDMDVWIGAGGTATNAVAEAVGATLNVWNVDVAREPARIPSVVWNWAGDASDDLEAQLDALSGAGATWAIFTPGVDIARLGVWRRSR